MIIVVTPMKTTFTAAVTMGSLRRIQKVRTAQVSVPLSEGDNRRIPHEAGSTDARPKHVYAAISAWYLSLFLSYSLTTDSTTISHAQSSSTIVRLSFKNFTEQDNLFCTSTFRRGVGVRSRRVYQG